MVQAIGINVLTFAGALNKKMASKCFANIGTTLYSLLLLLLWYWCWLGSYSLISLVGGVLFMVLESFRVLPCSCSSSVLYCLFLVVAISRILIQWVKSFIWFRYCVVVVNYWSSIIPLSLIGGSRWLYSKCVLFG